MICRSDMFVNDQSITKYYSLKSVASFYDKKYFVCCDGQQFHQYHQKENNLWPHSIEHKNTTFFFYILENVYFTKHETLSCVAYLEIVTFNSSHTTELLRLSEGLYPAAKKICSISIQCGFHRVHNNLTALFK